MDSNHKSTTQSYKPSSAYSQLPHIIIDKFAPILAETGMALYWFYARHINHKLGYAFPAINTTATILGISKWKVIRYNELLEELGLLKIEKGQGRRNNRYYLLKPSIKQLEIYMEKYKEN